MKDFNARKCELCGIDFTTKLYNKRFCSKECQMKNWSSKNKDKKNNLQREWRSKNQDKLKKYSSMPYVYKNTLKSRKKHIIKHRSYQNKYDKERRQKDINYKLSCNIRSRISKAMKKRFKNSTLVKYLGCDLDFLRGYLESMFLDGMSWENYGSWHIDHIKPLCSFNLSDDEQFKIACHYTNLQPLWAKDNLIKGKKIIGEKL